MTAQFVQSIGSFPFGFEVTREVFGSRIELEFDFGRATFEFPSLNQNYINDHEIIEKPVSASFEYSLRNPNLPSHITDKTWGEATSLVGQGMFGPRDVATAYIYRYLISISPKDLSCGTHHVQLVENAKAKFHKICDWLEVISSQDIFNGSAPFLHSKETYVWISEGLEPSPAAVTLEGSNLPKIPNRPLNLADFSLATERVIEGREPDHSQILLRDSRRIFHEGDFRSCVLLCGIAAEISMSRSLIEMIERGESVGIEKDYLLNDAGLGKIYGLWSRVMKKENNRTFTLDTNVRRDVAHRGRAVGALEALKFYTNSSAIVSHAIESALNVS